MSIRVLSFSALAVLFATTALAADADAPASKPVLNRAPLNMNDQIRGTTIRGQAPAGSNIISIDRTVIEPVAQADDNKPVQDDSLRGTTIRGSRPDASPASQGDTPVTVIRGGAPVGDPDSDVLPIEVVFHNMKNADCHPKDAKPADLARLQKSAACIELAKETEQLKLTYRSNQHVLDALADGRLR